ncbi:hypothetical protein [Reichenbachiella sp. MALMAid0571]|uniref:hypothetical protein n=1 Tax=Reichenbachiella sp. MALMAid0571 TaxID=3143939 RepID=UPI0032DE8942
MNKHLFPVFFLFFLVWSCAEDAEVFFNDPSLKIRFINADSLKKANDSLDITNSYIANVTEVITYLNSGLNVLEDSIDELNDSIDIGRTDYIEIRDALIEMESEFTSSLELMKENSTLLADLKSELTDVINTIESGDVQVTSITNVENNSVQTYSDSATTYNLPLSMNSNVSKFSIEIDGISYNLEVEYVKEQVVDEKRRIKIVVSDVNIISHNGFDSTSCQSLNCENETSVKLYF